MNMKRYSADFSKRKLKYPLPSEANSIRVDEYSPVKHRHVVRDKKKTAPRSMALCGRDDEWDRRMDGFDDILQDNNDRETHKTKKSVPTPKNTGISSDDDTQQDIEDWASSDGDKLPTLVIPSAKTLPKKRKVKRSEATARKSWKKFVPSQASTVPSIDDLDSPSSSPQKARNSKSSVGSIADDQVTTAITEYGSDVDLKQREENAEDDFYLEQVSDESLSPVISVPRSLSPTNSAKSSSVNKHDKSKPSDWVKDVQWQKTTPEKINEANAMLEDSGKKKKLKYLKDGLAANLQRLIIHEKSSAAFWNHRLAGNADEKPDTKTVTLKISSHTKAPSLMIADVEILSHTGIVEIPTGEQNIKVLFSEQVWREKKLKPGCILKIHPPWQMLRRPCGERVMLCTNHCQIITQELPVKSKGNATGSKDDQMEVLAQWCCPCSKDSRCAPYECPAHKNPFQPATTTSLLSLSDVPSRSSPSLELMETCKSQSSSAVPHSMLASIEATGTSLTGQISFVATIQRIFRKRKTKNVVRPSSKQKDTEIIITLLLQDFCGFICEMELPPCAEVEESWKQVLNGEGKTFEWHGITVLQRLNEDKCSKLFSVVNSVWCPEAVLENPNVRSQETSQEATLGSANVPTFSYMLKAPPGDPSCNYLTDYDSLSVYTPRVFQTVADFCQGIANWERKRLHLMGRVVYLQANGDTSSKIQNRSALHILGDDEGNQVCLRLGINDCCDCDNAEWSSSVIYEFCEIFVQQGECFLDEYSSVQKSDCSHSPLSTPKTHLPLLSEDVKLSHLYQVTGEIIGIEESTAYSWMVCPHCESDKLKGGTSSQPFVFCPQCQRGISQPQNRMNLEVYLKCSTLPKVRVKLLQETIETILPGEMDEEGYDVQCIMGKSVGPMAAIVTSVKESRSNPAKFHLKEISCLS